MDARKKRFGMIAAAGGLMVIATVFMAMLAPVTHVTVQDRVLKAIDEKQSLKSSRRYSCVLTFEGNPPVDVMFGGLCPDYQVGQAYPVEVREKELFGFRWLERDVKDRPFMGHER